MHKCMKLLDCVDKNVPDWVCGGGWCHVNNKQGRRTVRQFNSTSVIQAHPGNGLVVMRKLTSFLTSWLLAGPWLAQIEGVGLYFWNPRGNRQNACLMKTPEQKPGVKPFPAEESLGTSLGWWAWRLWWTPFSIPPVTALWSKWLFSRQQTRLK